MNKNNKLHWNKVYKKQEINQLGWYEENPEPSLRLIEKCDLKKHDRIIVVGSGASTLVDKLIEKGFEKIICNDISNSGLHELKQRLESNSEKVQWLVDDLTSATELENLSPVDLWHDRAVLHFFTEPADQQSYFKLLKKIVKNKGYVIISEFNLEGADKCTGLPVFRYSKEALQEELGEDFELISSFNHTYTQPSGNTREFIYTLFQRNRI